MPKMKDLKKLLWVVTCLIALHSLGCASSNIPRIEQGSLLGSAGQYRISTIGPHHLVALPPWQLEHFSRPSSNGDQKRLFSPTERVKFEWPSARGDDVQSVWWRGWEIELSHRDSNGFIRVGVFPWHPDVPARNLKVMAENIANDVSGSQLSVGWGALFGKRVASKVVSGKGFLLGGISAYRVTFEVLNLDQRELDPDSPVTKIDLVLSAAPVVTDLDANVGSFRGRGLLMLIHSNDVVSYEKTEPEFSDLLDRIVIVKPKR